MFKKFSEYDFRKIRMRRLLSLRQAIELLAQFELAVKWPGVPDDGLSDKYNMLWELYYEGIVADSVGGPLKVYSYEPYYYSDYNGQVVEVFIDIGQ